MNKDKCKRFPKNVDQTFYLYDGFNYDEIINDDLKLKCNKFAKDFINEVTNFIMDIIDDERDKECFIKYNNYDSNDYVYTLTQIGDVYSISGERVRQIINKDYNKLKRNRKYILDSFNSIIGEYQYYYLINGIMNYRNYRCLDSILNIVFLKKEYNSIKANLDRCINIYTKSNDIKKVVKFNKWTKKEDTELIESYANGIDIEEIALMHNKSVNDVNNRLVILGFENE